MKTPTRLLTLAGDCTVDVIVDPDVNTVRFIALVFGKEVATVDGVLSTLQELVGNSRDSVGFDVKPGMTVTLTLSYDANPSIPGEGLWRGIALPACYKVSFRRGNQGGAPTVEAWVAHTSLLRALKQK